MPLRLMIGITVVLFGIAACGRSKADAVPIHEAAPLIGEWKLRSAPAQRAPGLQLTIEVSTADGAQYTGRLTNYFSGNVGGDPDRYEAFADTVRHGTVRFFIRAVDRRMLGIVLQGTARCDTIPLDLFVLGPDTLSPGSRQWFLVRSTGGV